MTAPKRLPPWHEHFRLPSGRELLIRPIRPEEKPYGVIILTDSTPGEVEELGAVKAPSLEPEGELPAPEPFEWMPPSVPATDEGNKKND